MTHFDMAALRSAVDRKLVKAIPRGDLCIYDYTTRCQYERAWDDTTEQARGLVLDSRGRVIARPFRKFFNVGERPETTMSALIARGVAPDMAEKLDGSLIIAFRDPESSGWTTITRGSWTSWQAERAQEIIRSLPFPGDPANTYLFELVGPHNRTVVAYTEERMVLIGVRRTADGYDYPMDAVSEMARELRCSCAQFSKTWPDKVDLRLGNQNGEGYVARYDDGFRVKLKFENYVRLHKVMTGLSVLGVWEGLAAGKSEIDGTMPDEFMDWHRTVTADLRRRYDQLRSCVDAAWSAEDWGAKTRKDCARAWLAVDPEIRACLFARLDGDEAAERKVIWRSVRPTRDDALRCFATGEEG